MYTRLKAKSSEHLMSQSGPMVRIPPDAPGAEFLGFLGSAFQEHISVSRMQLLESARKLHAFVTANRHLLAFRYSYAIRMMGRANMVTKGSGGCSGFKIGGKFHSICGGNGECLLQRMEISDDGSGYVAECIDVRERTTIETDEWGDIKVSRRKIDFSLPETLADCISFLESVPDNVIDLFSFDKPPTLQDLLREFEEGSGGNDWAIEEVGRNAAKWQGELLAAVTDKQFSKHRAGVVHLLLICFPDAKTRMTVVEAIHGLPKKAQTELLTLVEAYASV